MLPRTSLLFLPYLLCACSSASTLDLPATISDASSDSPLDHNSVDAPSHDASAKVSADASGCDNSCADSTVPTDALVGNDTLVATDASDSATDCPMPLSCNTPLPNFGPKREFNSVASKAISALGAQHRGRDLLLVPGKEQWVLGKFAYGPTDKDLKGEEVDVYLLRDCGPTWTKLGTFATSSDNDHTDVYGVSDTGGRVFVNLSATGQAPLGVGRHRIVMVVAGDHSYADQYIDVLEPGARIVVSDVDGTLTSSEHAALTSVVGLAPPAAHPGAADMMTAFAKRGYHIFYLTARAEWMMDYTREWFPLRGFPAGIIHTSLSGLGLTGDKAAQFKADELAALKDITGVVPTYAFGNKSTDVAAYTNAKVPAANCYYFDLSGDLMGGHNHSDYTSLIPMASAAARACP